MKIAILQLNLTVGAVENNADVVLEAVREAYSAGARMVLTPEMALCGHPVSDLLLRRDFLLACDRAVEKLAVALAGYPDLYLLLGYPVMLVGEGDVVRCSNGVSVIHAGAVEGCYTKQMLFDAGVAGESRYFIAGEKAVVFEAGGVSYGILIGDEVWAAGKDSPAQKTVDAGAQVLLVLAAQPYFMGDRSEEAVSEKAKMLRTPVIVAQMAGAQDELVFRGASFAVDADGVVRVRAKAFDEEVLLIDQHLPGPRLTGDVNLPYDSNEALWRALVLGLKDYMGKNGFTRALLGLSGGMDSALVLAIAVDALGAENVHTVMMPSAYTSALSLEAAADMCKRLKVVHDVIPITGAYTQLQQMLEPVFLKNPLVFENDTTEENLQARVRGMILMAISNRTSALVLACGNKSEVATGYCTLYGDTVGGFAVIKDVFKTCVYALARWRNEHDVFGRGSTPIPEQIITRVPSAELRPGQTDQDNLPPYDVLDGIVGRYMEQNESIEDIVNAGYKREDVERVAQLIKISEYKRQQAPLGTKVSRRSFGADWRYPITSKYRA